VRLDVPFVFRVPARAFRRPLVEARFGVDVVRLAETRAESAVRFAPDLAARTVSATPSRAARPVFRAAALADDAVRFARAADAMASSVADAAPVRTAVAESRATLEPVGAGERFCVPRISAIRSWTAVTLPWATPPTVSPIRSTSPAVNPAAMFAGGVSGERGWG
jgi:hypothetical protein